MTLVVGSDLRGEQHEFGALAKGFRKEMMFELRAEWREGKRLSARAGLKGHPPGHLDLGGSRIPPRTQTSPLRLSALLDFTVGTATAMSPNRTGVN